MRGLTSAAGVPQSWPPPLRRGSPAPGTDAGPSRLARGRAAEAVPTNDARAEWGSPAARGSRRGVQPGGRRRRRDGQRRGRGRSGQGSLDRRRQRGQGGRARRASRGLGAHGGRPRGLPERHRGRGQRDRGAIASAGSPPPEHRVGAWLPVQRQDAARVVLPQPAHHAHADERRGIQPRLGGVGIVALDRVADAVAQPVDGVAGLDARLPGEDLRQGHQAPEAGGSSGELLEACAARVH